MAEVPHAQESINSHVPAPARYLINAARWPVEIDRSKIIKPDGAGHREPNLDMG